MTSDHRLLAFLATLFGTARSRALSKQPQIPRFAARLNQKEKGWFAIANHPFCVCVGSLEEHLQAELDSSWDVALAAGLAEVAISAARDPELIDRAVEHAIEYVTSLR